MATLNKKQKLFIVRSLAQFNTPQETVVLVKEEFSIDVSRQQCEAYDPTKRVGTPILLLWGTPIVTFVRSNLSVEKAAFEFDLGQEGIAPGVTVTWLLEGVSKTAISNAQGI